MDLDTLQKRYRQTGATKRHPKPITQLLQFDGARGKGILIRGKVIAQKGKGAERGGKKKAMTAKNYQRKKKTSSSRDHDHGKGGGDALGVKSSRKQEQGGERRYFGRKVFLFSRKTTVH